MKYQTLLMISLLIFTNNIYADSIYKCTKDNGQVTFTNKSCGKMKTEVIHQETEEEANTSLLEKKTTKISLLIRSGNDQAARRYAKKHQLEAVYKEEFEAYNLYLEQQIKQQALEAKKQDQDVKKQQLLIQQQSLLLQQQQIEQQRLQTEADTALAAATEKKRSRRYYNYPYNHNSYTSPSIRSSCQQNGFSKNCKQSSSYHQQSTGNKTKISGSISIRNKDKKRKVTRVNGEFTKKQE